MRAKSLSKYLKIAFVKNFNTLITGAPGVGKSSIVEAVAKELGYKLIISHPVVSDPTDYKGLPFAKDGVADFLPYGDLRELIDAVEPTIFFLDDLGQSSASVQAACMQLLLARQINGKAISDHVRFVAATNRKQDGAGVTGILNPVKSRFVTILELETNAKDWMEWAIDADVPLDLVGFINFKPQLLEEAQPSKDILNTVSPRTLAHTGKLLDANLPADLQFTCIAGAAGEGFATEFSAFRKLFNDLPSVEEIIRDPVNAKVSTNPAVCHAIATTLGAKMTVENIDPIVTYLERMSAEISLIAMMIADKRAPGIHSTKAFIRWGEKHFNLIVDTIGD